MKINAWSLNRQKSGYVIDFFETNILTEIRAELQDRLSSIFMHFSNKDIKNEALGMALYDLGCRLCTCGNQRGRLILTAPIDSATGRVLWTGDSNESQWPTD